MTHSQPEPTTFDLIYQNILGFMLPFFLASAGGNADLACNTIRALAKSYNVATELELVGRILGFSTVAMDNLRLSMNPESRSIAYRPIAYQRRIVVSQGHRDHEAPGPRYARRLFDAASRHFSEHSRSGRPHQCRRQTSVRLGQSQRGSVIGQQHCRFPLILTCRPAAA
jgi:hypothetical protein